MTGQGWSSAASALGSSTSSSSDIAPAQAAAPAGDASTVVDASDSALDSGFEEGESNPAADRPRRSAGQKSNIVLWSEVWLNSARRCS